MSACSKTYLSKLNTLRSELWHLIKVNDVKKIESFQQKQNLCQLPEHFEKSTYIKSPPQYDIIPDFCEEYRKNWYIENVVTPEMILYAFESNSYELLTILMLYKTKYLLHSNFNIFIKNLNSNDSYKVNIKKIWTLLTVLNNCRLWPACNFVRPCIQELFTKINPCLLKELWSCVKKSNYISHEVSDLCIFGSITSRNECPYEILKHISIKKLQNTLFKSLSYPSMFTWEILLDDIKTWGKLWDETRKKNKKIWFDLFFDVFLRTKDLQSVYTFLAKEIQSEFERDCNYYFQETEFYDAFKSAISRIDLKKLCLLVVKSYKSSIVDLYIQGFIDDICIKGLFELAQMFNEIYQEDIKTKQNSNQKMYKSKWLYDSFMVTIVPSYKKAEAQQNCIIAFQLIIIFDYPLQIDLETCAIQSWYPKIKKIQDLQLNFFLKSFHNHPLYDFNLLKIIYSYVMFIGGFSDVINDKWQNIKHI